MQLYIVSGNLFFTNSQVCYFLINFYIDYTIKKVFFQAFQPYITRLYCLYSLNTIIKLIMKSWDLFIVRHMMLRKAEWYIYIYIYVTSSCQSRQSVLTGNFQECSHKPYMGRGTEVIMLFKNHCFCKTARWEGERELGVIQEPQTSKSTLFYFLYRSKVSLKIEFTKFLAGDHAALLPCC